MNDNSASTAMEVPSWVPDAVFYQIFPDRFARSDREPKPTGLRPWNAAPTAQGYHGGDLWGVVDHLDHLVDLGITAIYLNPIFQSPTNHRYHTHDYEQVDPLLGGNLAFRALMDEAHRRGLRVILDGVFNHASRGFFQFNDILENGPHSPWLDWFYIHGWPLAPYDGNRPANYGGWLGNRELPKFNTDHPQVREFLMQIGERWIRDYDIDGWRLDVPADITTAGFWEEFRRRVRAIKREAYLVGEIWRDAREWVRGDRFDASMNYLFAGATIAFTAGHRVSRTLARGRSYDPYPAIDAAEFARRIEQLLQLYAWEVTQVQLNLLDSHDTPRLLSLARGDKATVRLATLFQMTFPGAPCIYYGDEIGLRGTKAYDRPHRDRDARWPFPWDDRDRWDQELLTFFRQAIALRHAHPVLRHGRYETLYAQGQCYAFARYDAQETLVVVLNAGEQTTKYRWRSDGSSEAMEREDIFGEGAVGPVDQGRIRGDRTAAYAGGTVWYELPTLHLLHRQRLEAVLVEMPRALRLMVRMPTHRVRIGQPAEKRGPFSVRAATTQNGRHQAVGQDARGVLLLSLLQDTLEGPVVALLLKPRQSCHGAIQRLVHKPPGACRAVLGIAPEYPPSAYQSKRCVPCPLPVPAHESPRRALRVCDPQDLVARGPDQAGPGGKPVLGKPGRQT